MWSSSGTQRLSHDRPCSACGHAAHTYLPCSETCDCVPPGVPGGLVVASAAAATGSRG